MKLGYDNLNDASIKLSGTYCLYNNRAFTVTDVGYADPNKPNYSKYVVSGKYMGTAKTTGLIDIDDPEFNCYDYKIGYINRMHAAAWFYRIPQKQWKQGLRHDQVQSKVSHRNYLGVEFRANAALAQMLEGQYPSYGEAAELLKQGEAEIMAFNRNFALKWNALHKDFVLEYKGTEIGITHNLKEHELLPQFNHLTETLKEVVG